MNEPRTEAGRRYVAVYGYGLAVIEIEDEARAPLLARIATLEAALNDAADTLNEETRLRMDLEEALQNVAGWSQELQDRLSPEEYLAMWRGCVAVARAALLQNDSPLSRYLPVIEAEAVESLLAEPLMGAVRESVGDAVRKRRRAAALHAAER